MKRQFKTTKKTREIIIKARDLFNTSKIICENGIISREQMKKEIDSDVLAITNYIGISFRFGELSHKAVDNNGVTLYEIIYRLKDEIVLDMEFDIELI